MKTDLATSIGLAIVGVIISYLICNILVGTWATDSYNIKTIESTVSADVASPDPEIFNYRALNPTVEVYVGNCKETDSNGQCIDTDTTEINQDIIDEATNDNSASNSSNSSNPSSDNNSQQNSATPTDNTSTREEE